MMKLSNASSVFRKAVLIGTSAMLLSGCFAVQQLRDKANEEKLLKPGALDLPVQPIYRTYGYKFLRKYHISHDWPKLAYECHYGGWWSDQFNSATGQMIRLSVGDIFEKGGITYQEHDTNRGPKYFSIDRYVRSEYTVMDGDGKPRTAKGFEPMCFQSWDATHHAFAIYLVRSTVDEWKARLAPLHLSFNEVAVGLNKWQVGRYSETGTKGRQVETWVLPIMETGYLFSFRFAHDAVSQQNPAHHKQMEEIFRHLIESVRIEPLTP